MSNRLFPQIKKAEIIPNFYAYTLKLNGRKLTAAQTKHFFECVNKIYRESFKVIFRGDKKHSLLQTYGVAESDFPKAFNQSLFVLGSKGRMFLAQPFDNAAEINIAGVKNNEFGLIFRMLSNLLNREFPFSATRNAMKSFRIREGELTTFFRNKANEQYFLDKIRFLNHHQKVILRDYYLALLHHIDKSEYYTSSFLLSTTSSFKEAHNFAWRHEDITSTNPIIFMGWVPKNYGAQLTAPSITTLRNSIDIEDLDLPMYQINFFPKQQEVTLKGGWLPDFLLGYLHNNQRSEIFEINPALFDAVDWDGIELPIDQSKFHQLINASMFGRYFTVNSIGEYEQYGRI